MKLAVLVGALAASVSVSNASDAVSENGGDGIAAPAALTPPLAKKSAAHTARVAVHIIPTSAVSRSSPNYLVNKHNVMRGLRGQAVPADRTSNPAAWHRIPYLEWGDMVTSTFHSWRGAAHPTGTFAGEFGNLLRWVVVVASTNGVPFSARQIEYAITSSFPGLNLVGNIALNSRTGAEIPYQFVLQGHHYGPDGAPNTGDDVWYDDDAALTSSAALVHEVYSFGMTSAFSAQTLADLAANRNVLTAPGYHVSCRVALKTGDGTLIGSAERVLDTAPRIVARKSGRGEYALDVLGQPQFGYAIQYGFSPRGPWAEVPLTYASGGSFTNALFYHPAAFFRLRQAAAP